MSAFKNTLKALAKSAFASLLPRELFDHEADMGTLRELFGTYVRTVEIENHSYCNRTCWFCPNAQIDRHSGNILMADAVYDKILSDLESIGYSQTLVWSRYHEPLAHESIYDRIAQARRRLPRAHLALISNGDYLNRETLRRIEDAGADRLKLDLYLPDGKERDPSAIQSELEKFRTRTGLKVVRVSDYGFRCDGTKVNITIVIPFFNAANTITRGGLVQVKELSHYQRTSVCFHPLDSVTVDYTGECVLCCNVRSDSPLHRDAVLGDLNVPGYTLFHFYRDLAPARRSLLAPGPKLGVCKTCTWSICPNGMVWRPKAAAFAAHIPGFHFVFQSAVKRACRIRKLEVP
ncbi:MAG: radical SAM protein [Terriglobia bacterium]